MCVCVCVVLHMIFISLCRRRRRSVYAQTRAKWRFSPISQENPTFSIIVVDIFHEESFWCCIVTASSGSHHLAIAVFRCCLSLTHTRATTTTTPHDFYIFWFYVAVIFLHTFSLSDISVQQPILFLSGFISQNRFPCYSVFFFISSYFRSP